MPKPPRTRTELDDRLKDNGMDCKLFSNDEAKDKARWVEKQIRLGSYRKKIDPRELR